MAIYLKSPQTNAKVRIEDGKFYVKDADGERVYENQNEIITNALFARQNITKEEYFTEEANNATTQR